MVPRTAAPHPSRPGVVNVRGGTDGLGETTMSGAASDDPGPYPFGEVVRAAVAAQERSLDLAQAWSLSLQELLRDQAEGGLAALEALRSTLAAMERALESQEEANRAMRQSLDAYRAVIERATATQQRPAQLVQASLDAFT